MSERPTGNAVFPGEGRAVWPTCACNRPLQIKATEPHESEQWSPAEPAELVETGNAICLFGVAAGSKSRDILYA